MCAYTIYPQTGKHGPVRKAVAPPDNAVFPHSLFSLLLTFRIRVTVPQCGSERESEGKEGTAISAFQVSE